MDLYENHDGEARAYRLLVYILSASVVYLAGCNHEEDRALKQAHPPFCGGATIERTECARPWLPHIAQVPLGGRWLISHSDQQAVRVGVASDPKAPKPTRWLETSEITFD